MPELPDVEVYVRALSARVRGVTLRRVRLQNPFLLRTAVPPMKETEGKRVREVRRLGKRIVLGLEDDLFLAIHLMIAGRLHWKPASDKVPKSVLAAFEFDSGILTFTEAGSKRRAALHLVRGQEALCALDRGGVEVLETDLRGFRDTLVRENHTLKRSLTDPRLFSGIGNSYSDEILHRARLSPVKLTSRLEEEEIERLFAASRDVLTEWTERLESQAKGEFPEKVTAFRKEMAVHGRFEMPCPDCGTPVQRIRYAENECNYCPACQTGGKLLADRALSRLLGSDWPKSLTELDERMGRA